MSVAGSLAAAAVLVVEAACVMTIAYRITNWLCDPDDDGLTRAVVGLVIGIGTVLGILQICGAIDLIRRGPVLIAHVVVAAVVLHFVPRRPGRRWREVRGWPMLAVAIPGVFFGGLSLALGLVGGPSTEPDTTQYHAPNVGAWLQVHNLWHVPATVPGYFTNLYPSNGELAGLWLMLPSHSDQLAYAVNVVFGVLAVLAVALAGRELGAPVWAGGAAGLAIVLTPLSFQTQTHSLMTDLAAASGIAAGAALALVAVRSPNPARWALTAGLALGIGAGSKDTALLPAVGVLVLFVALAATDRRVRGALEIATGLIALAGFWLVRTTVATGNPVFPAGLTIAGHQILARGNSPLNAYSTTLFDHVIAGRLGPLHRWEGFVRTLVGPAFLLVAVAGATLIVGAVRRNRRVFLVSGLAAAALVAYLVTPYTGGGTGGSAFLIASQLRYALPALLLAAIAATAIPKVTLGVAVVALAWDAVHDLRSPGFRTDVHPHLAVIAVAALIAVVVGAAITLAPQIPRISRAAWTTPAVAVLALAFLAIGYHRTVTVRPSAITTALAKSGRPRGTVMIVAVSNLRGLMGDSFSNQLVSPVDTSHLRDSSKLDPASLQLATRRLSPAVVVVPHAASATYPGNFVPAGYVQTGSEQGNDVYVPATTVPSAPPTTVPSPPTTPVPSPTTRPAPPVP